MEIDCWECHKNYYIVFWSWDCWSISHFSLHNPCFSVDPFKNVSLSLFLSLSIYLHIHQIYATFISVTIHRKLSNTFNKQWYSGKFIIEFPGHSILKPLWSKLVNYTGTSVFLDTFFAMSPRYVTIHANYIVFFEMHLWAFEVFPR